jgi:alpha-L-rhamnosidase
MGTNAYASAGWADAATIIPWQIYGEYGDTSILKEQYPSMKAWVNYMRSQSEQYLWNTGFHFGDWMFYTVNEDRHGKSAVTDKYYITQCFFAYSTHILAKAAKVLGYSEDAHFYNQEYQNIKKAFQDEYLSPNGRLGPNTQTAYVLALQFDLLPKHLQKQAAQRLVDNIKSYDYHLTTGFQGTPHLCHVLSQFGHTDIAFELLRQSSYPSWLYPITKGATTIWERWDGIKTDGSFQTPKINSFNHYAYGAIGDWMYQHLAGISRLDSTIGYQHIKIRPSIGGGINSAKGSLKTYYGTIRSEWKIENEQFVLQIEIPVNTKAEVYIPSSDLSEITEGRTPVKHSRDIQILETTTTCTKLSLGSGKYRFKCPYPTPTILEMLQDFSGSYESVRSFGPEIEIKVDKEYVFLHLNQEQFLLKEVEADYYQFHENSEKTVRLTRTRTGRIFSIVIQLAPGRIVAKKK